MLTTSITAEFLKLFQRDGNKCQIVGEIVRFLNMSCGIQDCSNMLFTKNLPKGIR